MELEAFRELISPIGQEAIADAAALAPTEAEFLGHFEKLRKKHPAALVKAALETVLLQHASPRQASGCGSALLHAQGARAIVQRGRIPAPSQTIR